VTPAQLNQMLDDFRPGQKASVLVSRRGELMRLDVTFGREPANAWRLEVVPDAAAEQQAHLGAWLGQ
jgi:predicted metalloprotease with PDZ domain